MKQRVTYGVRNPLRKDASWWAILVLLAYLGALGYYLVRRKRGWANFLLCAALTCR